MPQSGRTNQSGDISIPGRSCTRNNHTAIDYEHVGEPVARRYAPGPRLAALGRNVMFNATLRAGRRAVLARLVEEIGATCNFTMLDGAEVIYVDRVEAVWPLRVDLTRGSYVPLHCTASGKLLLALLPQSSRDRLVKGLALNRFTDTYDHGPRKPRGRARARPREPIRHRQRGVLRRPSGL